MNIALRLLNNAHGVALTRLANGHKQPFKFGCVAVRGSDGAMVASFNGSPQEPEWQHHAESRICRKLTPGSVVAVVRITAYGKWTMARPCPSCQRCMKRVGVTKVYYSISEGEYGTLYL